MFSTQKAAKSTIKTFNFHAVTVPKFRTRTDISDVALVS